MDDEKNFDQPKEDLLTQLQKLSAELFAG